MAAGGMRCRSPGDGIFIFAENGALQPIGFAL
jgi:hypothetical protein